METVAIDMADNSGIQAHLTPAHLLPKISMEQMRKLEVNFKQNRNPSELEICIISAEVGISEQDTKKWFEHRLACWRQSQGLPANSRSVND
ncbi:homeodomain-only protein-like [Gigantopelta aegis]|uniref:homeodomain-only protein-like n=1 Tax=Gigantopelta aegis TaxID=1735272 RepID=UPI001B887AB5|nr:homeodomain-only protein-like [Gigantopelta aegis]